MGGRPRRLGGSPGLQGLQREQEAGSLGWVPVSASTSCCAATLLGGKPRCRPHSRSLTRSRRGRGTKQLRHPGEPPAPRASVSSSDKWRQRTPHCAPGGAVAGTGPVARTRPRYLLNGLAHVQPHLHAVAGVRGQGHGQAGHAVVAVAQDLDAHALVGLWGKVSRGQGSHRQPPLRPPGSARLLPSQAASQTGAPSWGTSHQELLLGLLKGWGARGVLREERQTSAAKTSVPKGSRPPKCPWRRRSLCFIPAMFEHLLRAQPRHGGTAVNKDKTPCSRGVHTLGEGLDPTLDKILYIQWQ